VAEDEAVEDMPFLKRIFMRAYQFLSRPVFDLLGEGKGSIKLDCNIFQASRMIPPMIE